MSAHIDRREFIAQFDAGLNQAQLAKHFGCNVRTVSRIHKALDLPPFAGTPRWMDAERIHEIRTLLADGCSFAEITRTTGTDPETLRRHFPGQQWSRQECIDFTTAVRRIKEGPRQRGQRVAYDQKEKTR